MDDNSLPTPGGMMAQQELNRDLTDPGHGNSVAAWTAVAIILVGSFVACLAVIMVSLIGFIVGAVIIVLGVITWNVLTKMGYGPKPHTS